MDSNKMKSLAIVASLLLLLQVPIFCAPCHFPAIFNLGASNSDTGGFSAFFGPLPLPFGETFFHKPSGRFSDGRIILDFIAESLGLPLLSSYLDSLGANYSHGANFAVAQSTILPQNVSLTVGGVFPLPLDLQSRQLRQFKPRSQALREERGGLFEDLMPRSDYFSRALYTFDIGQNDLPFARAAPDEYFPRAMAEFTRVVKIIYEEGGRYFWIHNTGPLGCLPSVLVTLPPPAAVPLLDAAGCALASNALAQQFNKQLNETVAQLRKDLPLAAFTYVDVYSAKYKLFREASKFGFEEPLKTCCGYGGGKYNFNPRVICSATAQINGTLVRANSCKDPSKSIIWDGFHYTDAANKLVFDEILTGAYSYPPNSPSMACHKTRIH